MNSLVPIPEEHRAGALERYHVLRPAIEDEIPLTRVAMGEGVSPRTAQRWMAAYKRNGLAGLAKSPRSDKGHCHGLPEQLERAIEGLALAKPRPSVATVHRKARQIAVFYGWPEPTYRQVGGIVKRLQAGMRTLAHQGEKAYEEAFELVHRMEATRPNDLWQADHTLLDIWLSDEDGEPRRPWLTAIIDDHSRAVAGYFLHFEAPSAVHVSLALRQAIRPKEDSRWVICGIPERLYTDRGADFTSRRLEQVAADLRIKLAFSLPYKPRGRGKIERFFGTVESMFISGLPGQVAGGEPSSGSLLDLPRFEELFREWLLEVYQPREHGGTGESPAYRWRSSAFIPRMPDSSEQLDLLLLTVAKTRRVRKDGIHFETYRYVDAVLAAYVGEDVVIRYDPRDLAEIRVYYQDSLYVDFGRSQFGQWARQTDVSLVHALG